MNAISQGCACGCSPCQCAGPPVGLGCAADFCVPRPSFFSGQLVTADDLNAVVGYFQAKNQLLSKLAVGWGVLGGLRLLQPGPDSFRLFTGDDGSPPLSPPMSSSCVDTLLPNPQIVAGTQVQVSPGAAIDAAGRSLSLCASTTLDVLGLSQGIDNPPVARTCGQWLGSFCAHLPGNITASAYWVVAQQREVPTRPMPKLAGASDCAGDDACAFSRRLEDVRLYLTKDLPLLYFLHGCVDPVAVPCVDQFFTLLGSTIASIPNLDSALAGVVTSETLSYLSSVQPSDTANDAVVEAFGCVGFKFWPQLAEFMNQIAVGTCCTKPGVVLGRVLLATDVPGEVKASLGEHSHYVFIDDAFPYRRIIPNSAMHGMLLNTLYSIMVCLADGSPPLV